VPVGAGASQDLVGRALRPDEFSGGEAPGQANYVLRRLRFTVLRKGQPAEGEGQGQAGKDWSEAEVGLIVADYFDMLRSDLLGLAYSKADAPAARRLKQCPVLQANPH
jgi:hypothetical protein